jgi:ABC-type polysaccharide/polyol phosphate transport system ATPase subunit
MPNGGTDETIAIHLGDLSVRYRVPTDPSNTLKEYVIRVVQGRRARFREFSALNRLNLQVQRGETLGVIGRNGAGKSTLLKVIARVLRPTSGRVWVRGSVAALVELGAGFHPELTGRENVYLNGAILGSSHSEMKARFSGIVDFAQLWDFIDAPLRTYSSGMVMRLGFAVATSVDPHILLVDEVLAVGDEVFQEKCLARMKGFRENGTTIIFVSHDLAAVASICDRVVWMDGGTARKVGGSQEVTDDYRTWAHHELVSGVG